MVPETPSHATQVRFALARSRARQAVVHALARGGPRYLSEICQKTGMGPQNVAGAIRGNGERYAPELSLVSLGVVEETLEAPSRLRTYRLTPFGARVAAALAAGGLREVVS